MYPSQRLHHFYHLLLFLILYSKQQCVRCARRQDGSWSAEENDEQVVSRLTVTTWNDWPFSGISNENGTWVGHGYAFYILDLLSSKLNFTYTVVPPGQHSIGDQDTGLLGLLYRKKVDMAVAFLPILPEMMQYCKFSTALDETSLRVLMKRPQESASDSGILAPFDRTVWLFVLASLIFVGPVIYVFAWLRAKLWHDSESENYSLQTCFWALYSSMLKQGTNVVATTNSTRLLFATWWLFILILTSFYTANLTAFLTKPQFTLSISSVRDIIEKGFSWMTYEGDLTDYYLSHNNYADEELNLLKASLNQGKGMLLKNTQTRQWILKSINSKRLFIGENHYVRTILFQSYMNKSHDRLEHEERCTFVMMPESILTVKRGFAFPLDSRIANKMNGLLLRLVETGIILHEKTSDLPLANVCPVNLHSIERKLRNTDLLLTYKIVLTGYGIGLIIFILEMIYAITLARFKTRRKGVVKIAKWKKEELWTDGSVRIECKNLSLENRISLIERKPQTDNSEHRFTPAKKRCINGRTYYVVADKAGNQRLIPIRTPSALLFQYTV